MRINLLPVEFRPLPLFDTKRIILMVIGSVLVCASLFSGIYFYFQSTIAEQNLINITREWDSLQSKKQKIDKAESRMAAFKKRQDEVNNIKKSYTDYSNYLNNFANSLVDELWLKNIAFSNGDITLTGNSMSFAIIGDLLKNLDKQGFHTARLSKVSQQTHNDVLFYDFEIDIATQGGDVEYAQK